MRLKERLAGVVPEEKLEYLSNRFHVIGDIAILSLGPELSDYQELIASALLDQCSSIHTVFNKTTPPGGGEKDLWPEAFSRRDQDHHCSSGVRIQISSGCVQGFFQQQPWI